MSEQQPFDQVDPTQLPEFEAVTAVMRFFQDPQAWFELVYAVAVGAKSYLLEPDFDPGNRDKFMAALEGMIEGTELLGKLKINVDVAMFTVNQAATEIDIIPSSSLKISMSEANPDVRRN